MKNLQITDFFKPKGKKLDANQATISQKKEEMIAQQELSLANLISPFPEFTNGLASWNKPLHNFINGKVFQQIYNFLQEQYKTKTIYPKKQDIFNAFKLTPLNQIKAVIVGQDPYFSPNQAHGLCFSVLKPVKPPPSLVNIYKNLQNDPNVKFKKPTYGDLTSWAKQGVLMLNATLTVVRNQPNSHSECGWQKFTDEVIKIIDMQCEGIVFFLWGSFAQRKGSNINSKKHFILKTSHPSPYSVSNGFQTSRHFSKCNQLLRSQNKTPINWNIDI